MTKLRESTVQKKALEELTNYYLNRAGLDKIFARDEVWTKKEKGGKRADGLMCFKTEKNSYYTISLEAKSHRTLGALTSVVSDDKLVVHSTGIALFITLLLEVYLGVSLDLKWYFFILSTIVILPVFTIASFLLLDKLDLDLHKMSNVVEQLKQYPANEQWVAYSKYADNLLATVPSNSKKSHLKVLELLCKKNGFGLLLIGHQKNEVILEPRAKMGSFLHYYCREKEISSFLDATDSISNN